ncbi:hypothetical protein A1Q2_02219 [Trichosporon asahii var. asahii CBS 8904]|uniref:Translocation protein sec66 n=2 Tax=Trichosporon asahii var. asahii TaxID=189963 RepID=K1VSD0_TRIAC|nr:hypothetical protein A1Q1_03938 [Trichosporon asahii var. asahii CBS 2479]EJT47309.1 hypothetical protein A1Q1_03938 [Trichosporon asahii var. asahii CBS 2479]EKD03501.1 hypothetical protein A1Q2_02219 [Trichosporon asahii var. asahii CBS 8904]
MATSLAVPIAYITVLVTAMAIFSRIYRRRRAAEKTSFEPWFPAHPARDIYITLLSANPPVPESMLKSALLVRATADVKRIWRIKEDKQALASLHQRGLVGDDTMARFAAAEKELEAEIVDVVSEANTFRNGWGSMIFATASEMAHSEKTRDTVISVGRARQLEEKRMEKRAKLLGIPMHQVPATSMAEVQAVAGSAPSSGAATPNKSQSNTPKKVSPPNSRKVSAAK